VLEDLRKSYGARVIYDGFSHIIRRGERWAVMGEMARARALCLQNDRRRHHARFGKCPAGREFEYGIFCPSSRSMFWTPNMTIIEQLQRDFPQDSLGSLRNLGRRVPVLGRRRGQKGPRALGW